MERTNDNATTQPPHPPTSTTASPTTTSSTQIHHVLIIGAGPSALAVAARLREPTPSALYTDEEHRRFHWLHKHGGRSSVKDRKTGRVRTASSSSASKSPSGNDNNDSPDEPSLLVLDAEGPDWLTRWHALFAALRISHLRSPMFFHPDPSDRDALLAYAHSTTDDSTRARELVEIPGCVGREVSKHQQKKKKKVRRGELCGKCGRQAMAPATVDERERRDYFAPSAGVFEGFIGDLVGRYALGGEVVREGRVCDVRYGVVGEEEGKVFTVRTEDGNVHFARNVVVAVGAGNAPCVPKPFGECFVGGRHEAACHALAMRGEGALPEVLGRKVRAGKRTNVLVIGGGLTSAQIGDLVIKQGVTRVWHLMRGGLKVKPFDIDLNWMSKFRNQEKAAFWMADDDDERAEMLKQARGGGSITPRFSKILHSHIATGHASLHTHTTVTSQTYNPATQTFHLTTTPPIPSLPPIDHIYLATGVQSDVTTLPFMRSMVSDYPLETYDGLPALTDDLAWKEDVPLFMAGKFAGLRLGPGAANLEGARAGAERIVLAVEKGEGLRGGEGKGRRDSGFEEGEGEGEGSMERYGAGLGSRYEWLSLDE